MPAIEAVVMAASVAAPQLKQLDLHGCSVRLHGGLLANGFRLSSLPAVQGPSHPH